MLARRAITPMQATSYLGHIRNKRPGIPFQQANFTCIAQTYEKIKSNYTYIYDQAITAWDTAPVCIQTTVKILAALGCVGFIWVFGVLCMFMWVAEKHGQL